MKTGFACLLALTAIALPVLHFSGKLPMFVSRPRTLTVRPPIAMVRLSDAGPLRMTASHGKPSAFDRPRITHVHAVPDHSGEVLFCDASTHAVGRLTFRNGEPTRQWLVPANSLSAPCSARYTDLDGDGDRDVVVAVLGQVWPTDARCGQVALLENDGHDQFTTRILADHLRRITDVQPGDFDRDGDVDLIVAEFGYLHGGILYLERQSDGSYRETRLLELPGTVHVPVADFDNDGDLDFAAVVSQDHEQVVVFDNPGDGTFQPRPITVWSTANFDLGLAGMVADDLDQDGDMDLILSAGDNLELEFPYPQPWHGCRWLENLGDHRFAEHVIAALPGTYAASPTDLDGDGDRDIVLVSMFNDWQQADVTSLAWLENDGHQNYQAWHLDSAPTHLCTVATTDLDGDGRVEIIAGSLQIYPPFERPAQDLAIWKLSEATP